MKRVVWWTIEVEWEDGTREKLDRIPNLVAGYVDGHLSFLEDEANEDEGNTDEWKADGSN